LNPDRAFDSGKFYRVELSNPLTQALLARGRDLISHCLALCAFTVTNASAG